jgi:multidrug efflux pump
MGGMVGATVVGVLFVPIFFVVVRMLLGDRTDGSESAGATPADGDTPAP